MRNVLFETVRRLRRSHNIGTLILSASIFGLMLFAGMKPVQAQEITYTLSGVTFTDGATASGYFDFNPTTGVIGSFDMVTTNGLTDSLVGHTYTGTSTPGNASIQTFFYDGGPELGFYFTSPLTSTGTFNMRPGYLYGGDWALSSEFTEGTETSARAISTGSVTASPTVLSTPELPSTSVFALGLLGATVLAIGRRRSLRLSA